MFEERPVFKSVITSLKLRYSLLKYYYSLFTKNNGSGTIFRPLWFDYPQEDDDLINLESN